MKQINDQIKALRLEKGLTQAKISEKVGISVNQYSRIERGLTSPTLDNLQSIAKVLNVPYIYLLNNRVEAMESRVEKEEQRLGDLFSGISDENFKLVEGLIRQAARLRVLLDDNWRDILENGEYERFKQSENMEPYDRKRPIVENYDYREKQYANIINQLTNLLPKASSKTARNRLLGG
ncbi:helix-turn-helix domain-containing protein [Aerococcus kribbianus]|uniref:Helix-turn-helix transcriptional regulator n=1 Tax=Aerococcus kribbianus TaxID=2999064 RepID=A0A9X3FX40_9LACT|nr:MULTISPECIES: helix-turn-helix transcriptional regulator [unclassified Aerococcus]MCZ0717840.1 helix-turn-helix transcriptional regulator [Aerococcus sp. YH-aer221]MCZ0726127.1 helix-turn-helix transcriptional regulator [Aerococcus sp. YH-aer222]